ncbi:MAG TPA: chemotaxis protein [Azospirillaceae bacterium]|nr:chemotaxis protein [Azospirillaceae bacterium]
MSPSHRPAANGRRPRVDGFVNPEFRARAWKVYLGHHLVSDDKDVMMVTTLGSCVAACIHDPVARIGGMNHFLLPEGPASGGADLADAAARYGGVAMERLINALLSQGARRDRMIVKVFGGARVIESRYDIGEANARFVLNYISKESLTLAGVDLGGTAARRVHYFPAAGRAIRRLLRPEAMQGAGRRERLYREGLAARGVGEGEIELFEEE